MSRLDHLPLPNSPQGAPGYNGGNPGVAAEGRPPGRQGDFEDELFWHRPSIGQSAQGRSGQQQGQQVAVGDRPCFMVEVLFVLLVPARHVNARTR